MSSEAYKFTSTDAENYEHYLGPVLFEPYAKILASRIESIPSQNVLELACGSGRATRHIRRALSRESQLWATDLSADMLTIAKRNLGDDGIHYKTEDIQNLSFPDNTFDLVVCQFGVMFLPEKQKGFDDIYRVLKPGGRFLCFTWDATLNNPMFKTLINDLMLPYFRDEDTTRLFVPFSMHDPVQLRQWMEKAGFRSVNVETVTSHSGAATVEFLVEGLFLKHPLGKATKDKDEAAVSVVAEKFRSWLNASLKDGRISVAMSALLMNGTK